jgi:hypothetical protein
MSKKFSQRVRNREIPSKHGSVRLIMEFYPHIVMVEAKDGSKGKVEADKMISGAVTLALKDNNTVGVEQLDEEILTPEVMLIVESLKNAIFSNLALANLAPISEPAPRANKRVASSPRREPPVNG